MVDWISFIIVNNPMNKNIIELNDGIKNISIDGSFIRMFEP